MTDYNQEQWTVTEGADVVGSDGDKVGEVVNAYPDYIVVKKGFFFPSDYYIPSSAIANVDEGHVYLNVTKDEAMNQDPSWENEPVSTTTTHWLRRYGRDDHRRCLYHRFRCRNLDDGYRTRQLCR